MFFLSILLSIAASEEIHGYLDVKMYRRPDTIGDVQILLNGGTYSTFVKQDGSFVIYNVASGTYFMEIIDNIYYYRPILIEVSNQVDAYDGIPAQTRGKKFEYPLALKPEKAIAFFEVREPFSIGKMLYNPMVLMAGVTLLIVWLAPKMQLDPEAMRELREMQQKSQEDTPAWMNSMMNMFQPPGQ